MQRIEDMLKGAICLKDAIVLKVFGVLSPGLQSLSEAINGVLATLGLPPL